MKYWSIVPLFLAFLAVANSSCSETKANASTEFWVRGNCNMCKERIETALEDAPGIARADYDLDHNMAKVEFDSTLISTKQMHKVIADAGYDTQLKSADMAAYQLLPRCCLRKEDQ